MCLTLDNSRTLAATGQARAPAPNLFPSATTTNPPSPSPSSHHASAAPPQVGHKPFVCIWDPRTCKQIQRLDFPEVRGVAAVAFSGDSKTLVRGET